MEMSNKQQVVNGKEKKEKQKNRAFQFENKRPLSYTKMMMSFQTVRQKALNILDGRQKTLYF